MTVVNLTILQSIVLIVGMAIVYFCRDSHQKYREACRSTFLAFSILLVFNQFRGHSHVDLCEVIPTDPVETSSAVEMYATVPHDAFVE
jgi:hypothetical protein